jgi:acetoin utilization deacetylase AcuC-like enzyme
MAVKAVFHPMFYKVYTRDPAAEAGRMEAVIEAIDPYVEFLTPGSADPEDLALVHTRQHIESVRQEGLYDIAALAAGGAVLAARTGMREPCFAAVRPPGHHASPDSCWGFCCFSNMAVAVAVLLRDKLANSAFVLDFDLHYGDGTVACVGGFENVTILNPDFRDRAVYVREVEAALAGCLADVIGISAGFDNHIQDWGGVLATEDYHAMGRAAAMTARRNKGGVFALLEGGYNHKVLGKNALALVRGLEEGWG